MLPVVQQRLGHDDGCGAFVVSALRDIHVGAQLFIDYRVRQHFIEPRLSGQALCAVKSCVDSPLAEGVRIQTRASCGNEDCARVAMIAVCKPLTTTLLTLVTGDLKAAVILDDSSCCDGQ